MNKQKNSFKNCLIKRKKKIIKDSKKHALKNNLRLNPDKKIVARVVRGLLANENKHGLRYCPCRRLTNDPVENKNKICPCLWHQEEIKKDGHCLCYLFVK